MEEVLAEVVVITELPGGFGQKSQLLPEPIEHMKFKTIDVGDELRRREPFAGGTISAEEAAKLVAEGRFVAGMIPKKERPCRNCTKPLPDDRHWNCRHCVPVLPEDELEYMGVNRE
jgi:hypothetical protein